MLSAKKGAEAASLPNRTRLRKALRLEWLGQMAASLFWMTSVFAYGIQSSGDWLQLLAASAWAIANVAALGTEDAD
ncbi:MAG: hypothetical protein AAGH15_12340 [Myxococcota bacterium]